MTWWSANIALDEAGSIAVQNMTSDGEKKFFKVTKRNQLNSLFIIIEDMKEPPYVIDNLCGELFASCIQKGSAKETDITDVAPKCNMPFAWTDQ